MVLETIDNPEFNINNLSQPEVKTPINFDLAKEVNTEDWKKLEEYLEADYNQFQSPPEGIEQNEVHDNFLEIGAGMKILKPREFTSPPLNNYTQQTFEGLVMDEVTVKHQSSDELNFAGWRTLVLYPELKEKFDKPFLQLAKVALADANRLTWGALLTGTILFPDKAPDYAKAAKENFLHSKDLLQDIVAENIDTFWDGEESVDKRDLLERLDQALEAVAIYKILCHPSEDEIPIDQYFWPGLSNVLKFLRTEMHNDDSIFGSVGAACRFSTLATYGAIIASDNLRINNRGEIEISNTQTLEQASPMPEERSF